VSDNLSYKWKKLVLSTYNSGYTPLAAGVVSHLLYTNEELQMQAMELQMQAKC
jgi:hypothetical protein